MYKRELDNLAQLKGSRRTLLDVGCAKGVFLDVARGEGWTTCGVDVSEHASQYAREEFGLDVRTGTLEEVQFPSASFNVVTMWDLIEHLTHPRETVEEANRVLKDEGLLLLSTPNQGSLLHSIAHWSYILSRGIFDLFVRRIYGPGAHVYFFSEGPLRRLLNECGFKVERIALDPLSAVTMRRMKLWEKTAVVIDDYISPLVKRQYRLLVVGRKQHDLSRRKDDK